MGLHCPECKSSFRNVKIENDAVRCPECSYVMFVYRLPDEQLDPITFTELLETRGHEAARSASKWFKGPRRIAYVKAGLFIAWIWPQLAGIFREYPK